MVFYCLGLFCFIMVNNKIKAVLAIMHEFHNYLVSYRLTPRSRILRKHLP